MEFASPHSLETNLSRVRPFHFHDYRARIKFARLLSLPVNYAIRVIFITHLLSLLQTGNNYKSPEESPHSTEHSRLR